MSLRPIQRLVPRELPSKNKVTKACPSNAVAKNVAGLESDTCECSATPAKETFSRHAPASRRPIRLAGHGKLARTPRGHSSQSATPDSDEPLCSPGSFLFGHVNWVICWLCEEDFNAMAAIESAVDFRTPELKGQRYDV